MTRQKPSRRLTGDTLAERWTRLYTRQLDDSIAQVRRSELASDRFDHIAAARAAGLSRVATSRAIAARMLLGVPADLSWRRHHLRDERRAGGKENAMAAHAPDQAGQLASVAGFVVVSWILLLSVMSAVANGWPTAWLSVALVVGVFGLAVVGLVRLLRGHPEGAFLLAAAAFGSTVFFVWFPLIPVIGAAFTIGLAAYGVRARRESPSVEQPAG